MDAVKRLGVLQHILRDSFSEQRAKEVGKLYAEKAGTQLHVELLRQSPVGSVEPGVGRPSLRLHGKTLAQSYRPLTVPLKSGGRFKLRLDHPTAGQSRNILDWLTKGTPPHTYGAKGADEAMARGDYFIPRLRFWYGSPLRWDQGTKTKRGESRTPGYLSPLYVNHPGVDPNNVAGDFVENAFYNMRNVFNQSREEMKNTALEPVREFFR